MRQMSQNLQTGRIDVREVPPPGLREGGILVRTSTSLISAGTERMMLQLGKKSLLGKAKERPEAKKGRRKGEERGHSTFLGDRAM